jgi:hypothetical protein
MVRAGGMIDSLFTVACLLGEGAEIDGGVTMITFVDASVATLGVPVTRSGVVVVVAVVGQDEANSICERTRMDSSV